ncbi:Tyrosine kinase family catalytic domain protein [Ceratobasidium sp. AG-Ba]|nr:Tyrosine kinase family catalytic domain protein [Ceratobasidium sp. AG-Ba]
MLGSFFSSLAPPKREISPLEDDEDYLDRPRKKIFTTNPVPPPCQWIGARQNQAVPDPPHDLMAYDRWLQEVLPSQAGRYDSYPACKQRRPPSDLSLEARTTGLQEGWKEYHHPDDGRLYFYNEELRIITEMCIERDSVLDLVMNWYSVFVTLRDRVLPDAAGFDVFLDCSNKGTCRYYMVDHTNATICWLSQRATFNLGVRNVLERQELLEEEYWTHAEYMPKDDGHSGTSRPELKRLLASMAIDAATSSATAPLALEECLTYLKLLNDLVDSKSVHANWLVARIMGLLGEEFQVVLAPKPQIDLWLYPVRSRNIQLRGQDGARLDCTVTAKGGLHLFRSPLYFDRIKLSSLESRWAGRIAYTQQWAKYQAALSEEWPNTPPPVASLTRKRKVVTTITSHMGLDEVMQHLTDQGCRDLTNMLDVDQMSSHPIAWGGFGAVSRCQLRDGTQVAVKYLYESDNLDTPTTCKVFKRMAREIYCLLKCNHRGILPLYGIARIGERLAIVSPWMKKGNLRSFLRTSASIDRLQLCLQLASALEYMHLNEIVHGDIKPDNIVISDHNTALLTDLGNAVPGSDLTLQFTATSSSPVSLRYTAPEVLKGESMHTTAGDIYAYAMTIYEVLTGEMPFANTPGVATVLPVVLGKIPDRKPFLLDSRVSSDRLWKLLTQCWAYEPKARPSLLS